MSTESKDKTLINMPPPPPEYPGHDKLLPPEPPGYPVPDYPPPAYSSVQESSSKDKSMIQVELGQESAKIICQNCFYEVSTRVDSTVSTSGWAWAIICCFCGSWIASCLVNCLPGFRKYTHSCPNCNALIREVEPNHKTYHKIILAVAILLVIALLAFLFFVNLRI